MTFAKLPRFERLLWLMPAAYAIHIFDEFFSGFTHYVVEAMGGHPMPTAMFIANNSIFMTILIALSVWATRRPSRRSAFLLMAWASGNLFWNFIVHLYFTVATGEYSPGLITATFLYYPIPFLVTVVAIRQELLSVTSACKAYAIGGALMLLVMWGGLYHFAV